MDLITLAMAKAYTNSQRLGYVADAEIVLDVSLTGNPDLPVGSSYQKEDAGKNVLQVGKTYTVTTDSGTFTSVCKEMNGTFYIGNMTIFGFDDEVEDTGESFVILTFYEGGWVQMAVDHNHGNHMLVVGDETIVSIDPKYLPGVCLPVVELSTEALDGHVAFTDAENAALTACIGMPFILKIVNSTVSASLVMEYSGSGNEHMFARGNTNLYTNNGGETWTVMNA